MSATSTTEVSRSRTPASVALRRIRDQHVELRRLLGAGLKRAGAVLAGDEFAHLALRVLVAATHQAFLGHLAEEEALLLPILDDDLPLGPLRAQRLRHEHAHQREEIAALFALCQREAAGEAAALAVRFRELARAIFADMEHEELTLLTPEVIRDDGVVVDQDAG